MLLTCGAFTPQGEFLELPELDLERLQAAWQEAVFALYLAEDKIEPEVVENMRTWPHSGFSVDQSVFLPAGDRAGIERLVGYMTRCPFSLSRLVKVSETGQVIYKAEKDACRAFPDPQHDELARGPAAEFPDPRPAGIPGRVHAAHSAAGHAPDSRAPTEGWSRLVLQQGPRHAAQGRPKPREPPGTAAARQPRRRTGSGPQPRQPDLGHAHQAGVRDSTRWPARLWRDDESGCLYRAAAGAT